AITGHAIRLAVHAGPHILPIPFSQIIPISHPNTPALFTPLILTPSNFLFLNNQPQRFVNQFQTRHVLSNPALQ
ncbi:hypothetical protein, partial [Staphylococcus epidermidis]|uniref:hypothetical protein n=1 Tax=Staphylococcus epidermidis TaxID=1282 RepID=UPI001C92CDC7